MEELLTYSISFFWVSLEAITVMLLFSAFLNRKQPVWKVVPGVAIIALLAMLIFNQDWVHTWIRFPICAAIYLPVTRKLFDGKLLSHLLLLCVSYSILALTDVYFINGVCALIGIPFNELVWMKRSYVMLVSTGKLLDVFIAWLIRYVKKPRQLGQMRGQVLLLATIFPATEVLILYYLYTSANAGRDVSPQIAVASIFLTVTNVAVLYILTALEKAVEQEQNVKLLKQQMELQSDQLKAMELNYRSQRRITHEFERHLQTMQDLLRQERYDLAEEYISRLQKDRTLRIVSIDSRHPVFNAILNQKYQMAQESNVQMQIEVNDLSGVDIPTDRLVVLLSNLLDNALEACLRLEDPGQIRCRILKEDSLYIAIRNTSLPVEIREGKINSSKSADASHGYGLQAVRYVLAELNGEYTFDYSDGWFRFAAEIPIP